MRKSDTLTVAEVMHTAVVPARPEQSVEEAYRQMLEGHFRHMPVVTAQNKLVGVVSDRDLRNVLVFLNDSQHGQSFVGDRKLTVAKVMTREPLRVAKDDLVRTAVKLMVRHKVGCLPVCDENDHLLGIITETDMLKLLENLLQTKGQKEQKEKDKIKKSSK